MDLTRDVVSFLRKRGPLDRLTRTGSAVLSPAIYRGHKGGHKESGIDAKPKPVDPV
jgi:hypothetical protein